MMGIKNILIAAGIAFMIGFAGGWTVCSWKDNAAFYRAQVEQLQKQIAARDAAAQQDAEQIAQDQEQIDQLKRKATDAENRIGPGECLSPDDTDSLRDLWK